MIDTRLIVIGLIFFGSALGTGFYLGDKQATEKYLPQVLQLTEQMEAADREAKRVVELNEKVNKDAEKSHNTRIANINAYYDRLLHSKDRTGTSTEAKDTLLPDGEPGELQTDFSRACALDANHILELQAWIISVGIQTQ